MHPHPSRLPSARPPHYAPQPALRRAPRRALLRVDAERCLALLGLALLAGCTLQPTPYQPLGEHGGYEESRLQERVFRVSFRGNRATPETTVLDFLFLRCAELTRQNGFTHFAVEEDFGRTQLSVRAGPPRSSVGVGVGHFSGRSFWSFGMSAPLSEPDYETVVSYHLAVFLIRMLSAEEARQGPGPTYEADYLIRSLAPKKEASLKEAS
jgi:hypothetical protein